VLRWVILTVVLGGCSEGVPVPDGERSTVTHTGLDMRRPERLAMPGDVPEWEISAVPDWAISAALEASDLWCAATGWCPEIVAGEPAEGDWGLGVYDLPGTMGGIALYDDRWILIDESSERCAASVIAHELAHAAGLEEHRDTGLMIAGGSCPEPEIDDLTRDRFCALWHCPTTE
jgi:hypothetical protein